jgi:hypothetical protein
MRNSLNKWPSKDNSSDIIRADKQGTLKGRLVDDGPLLYLRITVPTLGSPCS